MITFDRPAIATTTVLGIMIGSLAPPGSDNIALLLGAGEPTSMVFFHGEAGGAIRDVSREEIAYSTANAEKLLESIADTDDDVKMTLEEFDAYFGITSE